MSGSDSNARIIEAVVTKLAEKHPFICINCLALSFSCDSLSFRFLGPRGGHYLENAKP